MVRVGPQIQIHPVWRMENVRKGIQNRLRNLRLWMNMAFLSTLGLMTVAHIL